MIPPRAEIEHLYSPEENEQFDLMRRQLALLPDEKRNDYGRRMLRAMWPDPAEFRANTHWITDKAGGLRLLRPNFAQQRLLTAVEEAVAQLLPVRVVILKARQLGFSTLVQSYLYEECDRRPYYNTLTISYDDDSTEELFQKSHLIHKRMWFPRTTARSRTKGVQFSDPHGSSMFTKTAGSAEVGRSYRLNGGHCSEMPMWTDAERVLTGFNQSVPVTKDTIIFYESTAKGAIGEFYDLWTDAESGQSNVIPFFAPWFWDPEYALPFTGSDAANAFMRRLLPEDRAFAERYKLTPEQMQWRDWKIRNSLKGSVALFRQEFPSCAEEAFLTSGDSVFNADRVRALRDGIKDPIWRGEIGLVRDLEADLAT